MKTLFLFFGTWIILYFILRSISRFAVYGYLSTGIMYVTEKEAKIVVRDEAKNQKKEPQELSDLGIWAMSTATLQNGYVKMKIYYVLPGKWFFSLPSHPKYPNQEKIGTILLILTSAVLSFLLLLFLW